MPSASARIHELNRAGQARVERVNGAKQLEGLVRVRDRMADQRGLVRTALPHRIARPAIPRAGRDHLVITDGAILDLDPVA
jgi:hypothetical protein